MVNEITILALNEMGINALRKGIQDDKKEWGRNFRIMRKVITTNNSLAYCIRFRENDILKTKSDKTIINSVIETMLKNGCTEKDFEVTVYD